jgi:flagellar assembly factor FliW
MIIQTTRFGNVVIDEKDEVRFPEGLLGFADLKSFVLLEDPSDDIFAWLQSCEEPAIAFPVLEPELFTNDYVAQLTRSDLLALEAQNGDVFRTFCIVTIPDDPTLMTANLKAPIVINLRNRIARQCVLQDNNLAIREPIFTKLQAKIMSGQWKMKPAPDQDHQAYDSVLVPLVRAQTERPPESNLS